MKTSVRKKSLFLFLAVCMAVSFSGCSPGEGELTQPDTIATTQPSEGTAAPADAVYADAEETSANPTEAETEPTSESPQTDPSLAAEPPTEKSVSDTSQYPLTYSDATCSITITKEWYENAWCYIAHLQFTDYSRFGTSCANGKYDNGYETTSHAASRLDAIFAVNGCYSAPYLNYTVVRNGELCNGSGKNLWCPAVYSSATGLFQSAWETGGTPGIAGVNVDSLVESGLVTDTFCFGPPILADGSVTIGSDTGRAQRTFIGTSGNPGDLWIVVSEGRYADGESAGLTYNQCARLLAEKGCTFGVPLDGGGSSTMVFQGQVLNSAKVGQRAVVDFVYFK